MLGLSTRRLPAFTTAVATAPTAAPQATAATTPVTTDVATTATVSDAEVADLEKQLDEIDQLLAGVDADLNQD